MTHALPHHHPTPTHPHAPEPYNSIALRCHVIALQHFGLHVYIVLDELEHTIDLVCLVWHYEYMCVIHIVDAYPHQI